MMQVDRNFLLNPTCNLFCIIAIQDRGVPPKTTNTTIKIVINDNDDLPPKFTKGVYRTRITEFYPITVSTINYLPIYSNLHNKFSGYYFILVTDDHDAKDFLIYL